MPAKMIIIVIEIKISDKARPEICLPPKERGGLKARPIVDAFTLFFLNSIFIFNITKN